MYIPEIRYNLLSTSYNSEIKFCEENMRTLVETVDSLIREVNFLSTENDYNKSVINFIKYSCEEDIRFFENLYHKGIRDKTQIDFEFKIHNRKKKIQKILA